MLRRLCLPSAGFLRARAPGRSLLLFRLLFPRRLRRHHRIRLPDQLLQLVPADRIQPVQHHPFVAAYVRGRMNVLALNQLGKGFRRAFEAKPRIIQADDRKNPSPDLEAEVVAPLQVLGGRREGQTKLANRIYVHLHSTSASEVPQTESREKEKRMMLSPEYFC